MDRADGEKELMDALKEMGIKKMGSPFTHAIQHVWEMHRALVKWRLRTSSPELANVLHRPPSGNCWRRCGQALNSSGCLQTVRNLYTSTEKDLALLLHFLLQFPCFAPHSKLGEVSKIA